MYKTDLPQETSPGDTSLELIFDSGHPKKTLKSTNKKKKKNNYWEAMGKPIPFSTLNFKSHNRHKLFCNKEEERRFHEVLLLTY